MKSTKKKSIEKDGVVYAHGRLYTKESLNKFRKYQQEYLKEKYRRFTLRIKSENKEIITWLESQNNFNEYVATLIQKDYEKKKKKEIVIQNKKH